MKRIAAVIALLVFIGCRDRVVQASGLPAGGETKGRPEAYTTPTIQDVQAAAIITRSQRNPFAYKTTPVVVPIIEPVKIVATPPPQPVVAVQPPAPKPPHFPYRYIGTFGPAHDPIAAFAGDGTIITVRPGDRIDDVFVLRKIGLESVEIEARGWDRRIPIALGSAV